MEEYESLGKDGFESKWTKNGELLPSHRIIQELRKGHRKQDEEFVAAAKHDYPGELFAKFFSYSQNGSRLLLKDARSIARKYIRLKEEAGRRANAVEEFV
jgi:hypothetical protein